MADLDELATRFRDFGRTSAARAPLYGRLSDGIAERPALLELLHAAPAEQQLPVLLFAAVHHLVLSADSALREWYPNLTEQPRSDDPLPVFTAFCEEHRGELLRRIETRTTQTNEVGRCAQFLPAFGLLAEEVGTLAHLDVGTSAGLNLLLPRFQYRYSPGGTLGADSPIVLDCATRGNPPIPSEMPTVARSVGVDIAPIDVADEDAVRWLEACVWPDQADRFQRLVAAIDLARAVGLDVRRGDAVDAVPALVAALAGEGHPVITNSWVLNYLTGAQRLAYLDMLETLGAERDISWVVAESPAQTPELPVPTTEQAEDITVVSLITWRHGERRVRRLATTHPHGFWLHWEPPA